jgi:capsular polysaccharide biosynthesis protein
LNVAVQQVTLEIDHTTSLPLVSLSDLFVNKSPAQSIAVSEQYVQVKRHHLSTPSSNEVEQQTYSDHQFRAPEMRLERLTEQYWFPESGFLISKKGKVWRHSTLGQYAAPNFLTSYAVKEQINEDGSKRYNFHEYLLHDVAVVTELCLIVSHYASHNFGHFMMDMVPLIQLAKQHNLAIISRPLLEWQRPIYRAIGFNDTLVATYSQRAVFLKEVIVSNRHNAESTFAASPHHRVVFEALLQKIKSEAISGGSTSRFFLSRGKSRNRDIRNRDALQDALRLEGFETVRPELLSFEQQALLFSKADIIVSEFGAIMANVVFCRPGTKIIEIIPENQNDPWSSHLCASMALEHVTLFQKAKDEDRESIEIGGRIHTNIFFKFDVDIAIVIDTVRRIEHDVINSTKCF